MMRAGWLVAVGALAAVADPAPGVAQQADEDCRCVGPDGDRIENCTCLRMPRFEAMMAPFGARPRLGLSVRSDGDAATDAGGARVAGVLEDGPAYEAGLREGDLITSLDGRSLQEPLDPDLERNFDPDASLPVQRLLAIARRLEPGQQVEIEYLRGDERRTASVEAQELTARSFARSFDVDRLRADTNVLRERAQRMREEMRGFGPRQGDPPGMGDRDVRIFRGSARYGLELVELNEGLGSYFGTTEGVLVTDVDDDSPLGLQPGDVILRVGEREVTTPDRVLSMLRTYDAGEEITFRIRRDGREISVMGRAA